MMGKVVIERYGPPDLVDRLRKSPWTACKPSGKNFCGIAIGRWVLTDTPDTLCADKYRITVETVPRGDKFMVEGYQSRDLFNDLQHDSRAITFAGCHLIDDYVGEVKAYRATIEHIS
jgi:hypothetical protein